MKKFIIPIVLSVFMLLLVPFLASQGWTAPLKSYIESSLPGSPVFESHDAEYENVLIPVLNNGKVEQILLFDYLCGVVCAEMPATYEIEALKAQTVAACSYMIYRMESEQKSPGLTPEHNGAYVCTDPSHCKGYLSQQQLRDRWGDEYFTQHYPKIKAAVNSVLGEVITYEGRVANAVFHAISAGKTENAADVWGLEIPYLVAVESYADTTGDQYLSSLEMSGDELFDLLSLATSLRWIPLWALAKSAAVAPAASFQLRFSARILRAPSCVLPSLCARQTSILPVRMIYTPSPSVVMATAWA